jgi:hypothetical protein
MEGCMDGDVGWVDAGSIEELKVGDPKLYTGKPETRGKHVISI